MSEPHRIVYAGTPEFAVPPFSALIEAGYHVVAVYTQPDRPAGRGRAPRPSPVKQTALDHGIAVYQPESLTPEQEQKQLQQLEPDLMIVTAYGLLLPEAVLNIPRLGCINIHASLLPRWRGAAPIQRAILAGDDITGITIMQMDAGLDTGGMLASESLAIGDNETASQLHDRLKQLGADTLMNMLPDYLKGNIEQRPQNETDACYAKKLSKQQAELDWSLPAAQLQRCIRAYNAWPVAFTYWKNKKGQREPLRIWQAQALKETHDKQPGSVLRANKTGIDVAAGEGVLRLLDIQPAGKRQTSAADFVNAHDLNGQVLG